MQECPSDEGHSNYLVMLNCGGFYEQRYDSRFNRFSISFILFVLYDAASCKVGHLSAICNSDRDCPSPSHYHFVITYKEKVYQRIV